MSNAFIAVRNYTVHMAASEFTADNIAGKQITEEQITALENKIWGVIQEHGVKGIGRRAIRSVLFNISPMNLEPNLWV